MSDNLYFVVKKGAEATANEGGATNIGACAKWAAMPDRDQYEVVKADLSGNVIAHLSSEEALQLGGIPPKTTR